MKCNFSCQHYRNMLVKAIKSGYKITNFRDFSKVKNASKIILLRHDIDSLPYRHLAIAKIEASLGIKSTYFIRVHGQFYHPFDRQNYPIISKINALGHELGLHSEARNLASIFKIDAKKIFLMEKNLLEDIFDLKIESASEHADYNRPANFWQNHFFKQIDKKEVGIKYYPQEDRFKNFYYLSDSLWRWRNGCLCQNLGKYNHLHVLVHADLWGKGGVQEVKEIIRKTQW